MSPDELTCWRCGGNLKAVPLPYGRRAECPACRAELHVCRMCRHYAPGKAKQCLEPMSEDIKDKTRGNFCDWFQPAPAQSGQPAVATNRDALADLFGGSPATESEPARKTLDDLFGG
jgi:hypothetical protein